MAVHHYSYAIPDSTALDVIQTYTQGNKLIEIGSGSGYWTYLLRQQGVQVDAVDTKEEFKDETLYWIHDTIHMKGTEYLANTSLHCEKDVLLLVWPRQCKIFLDSFKGTYVIIWVGEIDGFTGEVSEREWRRVREHHIPKWRGNLLIHS